MSFNEKIVKEIERLRKTVKEQKSEIDDLNDEIYELELELGEVDSSEIDYRKQIAKLERKIEAYEFIENLAPIYADQIRELLRDLVRPGNVLDFITYLEKYKTS